MYPIRGDFQRHEDKVPIGEPREIAISQEVIGGRVSCHSLEGSTLIELSDQGVTSVEPVECTIIQSS